MPEPRTTSPRSICRRTMATMSWPRFMPVCSAMPSRSARANSLGIGSRYRSSSRVAALEAEAGGGVAVATVPPDGADAIGAITSCGLRGIRRRVALPDPSSLRATAIVLPPKNERRKPAQLNRAKSRHQRTQGLLGCGCKSCSARCLLAGTSVSTRQVAFHTSHRFPIGTPKCVTLVVVRPISMSLE